MVSEFKEKFFKIVNLVFGQFFPKDKIEIFKNALNDKTKNFFKEKTFIIHYKNPNQDIYEVLDMLKDYEVTSLNVCEAYFIKPQLIETKIKYLHVRIRGPNRTEV